MYCVMCKWERGPTELIDTFPTRKAADKEAQEQKLFDKFMRSAGLHQKPRNYFVEEETGGRRLIKGRG